MNVHDVKMVLHNARIAQSKSKDPCFQQNLDKEITSFQSTFTQFMGKPINQSSGSKAVPQEIECAVDRLTECYSV